MAEERREDLRPITQGMISKMLPQVKAALPSVMTPERFTRMVLTAYQQTPRLSECTAVSFLTAMLNTAQLGLEPNTPLGQAYLIPYWNGKKKCREVQFQIGYKGLLSLAYRNPNVQTIQAHTVFENDTFIYEFGLDERLVHKPALRDRGEIKCFYALYKLATGGFGFEVMSKEDIDNHRAQYSKADAKGFSPWETNYEEMAKKTVIKKLLKYAPLSAELQSALAVDESVDMIPDNVVADVIAKEVQEEADNAHREENPFTEDKPMPEAQKSSTKLDRGPYEGEGQMELEEFDMASGAPFA